MARMYRPLLAAAAVFTLIALACDGGADSSPNETPEPTDAGSDCSPARSHGSGATSASIQIGGEERQYLLHVPPSYDGSSAAPVVIALHGLGASAGELRDMTALADAAGARGMVTVFPEGTGAPRGWNAEALALGADDSAFLSALLDELATTLCIDEQRVYVAGYSNGGGMALRLACEASARIAAAAVVASTYPLCRADVPVLAFHGNADLVVPYEGGEAPGMTGIQAPVHRATSEWARGLGCDGLPRISRAAPDVELATYENCPKGDSETLLYTVLGGGHTWPGAAIELDPSLAGVTTKSISANEIMMDFFEGEGIEQ
jgi:polyhydroxybutyrate depolymerase